MFTNMDIAFLYMQSTDITVISTILTENNLGFQPKNAAILRLADSTLLAKQGTNSIMITVCGGCYDVYQVTHYVGYRFAVMGVLTDYY